MNLRQLKATTVGILALLALVACDDVERRLSQGTANLASGIGTGITVKRSLLEHGLIDGPEDKAITQGLLQLNQNVQLLNHWLTDQHTNHQQSRSALLVILRTIAENNQLLQQTLRVKNPAAQQELSVVMTALNAGTAILAAISAGGAP